MTPSESASLQWFAWGEFHHPELMSFPFVQFLDKVRQEYGFPLTITSDARTARENDAASGSSKNSRHLVGEAVDLRFPPTANHLWLLVQAIFRAQGARPVELELVYSPHDEHVHLAFLPAGKASALIVAAD